MLLAPSAAHAPVGAGRLITSALIILTGAAVRLSQSGLGCPDWPHCTAHSVAATGDDRRLAHPSLGRVRQPARDRGDLRSRGRRQRRCLAVPRRERQAPARPALACRCAARRHRRPGGARRHRRARRQRSRSGGNRVLLLSNSARWPVPNLRNAPAGPDAFGRLKIQFCQAVSRPKIFVSIVSGPANRKLASIPVKASGLKLARSSTAIRTSSAQSMSSGAKVTRPSSAASAAASGCPRGRQDRGQAVLIAEETRLQPGEPVAHRQPAEVHLGHGNRGRTGVAIGDARIRPTAGTSGLRPAPAPAASRRSSCPARSGQSGCGWSRPGASGCASGSASPRSPASRRGWRAAGGHSRATRPASPVVASSQVPSSGSFARRSRMRSSSSRVIRSVQKSEPSACRARQVSGRVQVRAARR